MEGIFELRILYLLIFGNVFLLGVILGGVIWIGFFFGVFDIFFRFFELLLFLFFKLLLIVSFVSVLVVDDLLLGDVGRLYGYKVLLLFDEWCGDLLLGNCIVWLLGDKVLLLCDNDKCGAVKLLLGEGDLCKEEVDLFDRLLVRIGIDLRFGLFWFSFLLLVFRVR